MLTVFEENKLDIKNCRGYNKARILPEEYTDDHLQKSLLLTHAMGL